VASPLITGIDIGAETVKVLSLRRRGTQFQVLGAGLTHVPPDLEEAPDPAAALGQVIGRLIRQQRIPVGRTVMGLSGKGSLVRCLSQPICPRWKLAMLMSYEVEEQSGGGGEVAFDFRPLDLPEFEEGQFSVLLAQAQAEVVQRQLAIGRRGVRRADEVDMSCLGVFNLFAVSPACNEEEVSLVLDVGAEETSLSLQRGSAIYYARTISGGGRRFTQRIASAFDISFEAAEELKLESEGILPEPSPAPPRGEDTELVLAPEDRARRVSQACRAEAATLASSVQSTLVFFRNQLSQSAGVRGRHPKLEAIQPEKLYVTGGGGRLPGLPDALGGRLRLPAEALDVGTALPQRKGSATVALEGEQAACFATAAGLALGRARAQGFALNLLPESERERRTFWDRTVYAGAAAVAGLVLLVLLVLGSSRRLAVAQATDENWRQAASRAAAERETLLAAQSRNRRLAEMVAALEERRTAGPDLLRFLDGLRRTAPENFFLTELATDEGFARYLTAVGATEPGAAGPRRPARGRRPRPGRDTAEEPAAEPEEAVRRVRLIGYCLVADEVTGSAQVTRYIQDLRAEEGVHDVTLTERSWVEDPAALAGYFQAPGEVQSPGVPAAAFRFELLCELE
jgi:type IV pilus assembly protein PilM